jgi:hypothetical protein
MVLWTVGTSPGAEDLFGAFVRTIARRPFSEAPAIWRKSCGVCPVQLGDDVRDGLADARDFLQTILLDQVIERDREGGRLSAARE